MEADENDTTYRYLHYLPILLIFGGDNTPCENHIVMISYKKWGNNFICCYLFKIVTPTRSSSEACSPGITIPL